MKRSIARYNADAREKRDSLYGRTSFAAGYGGLVPVEKPPFYAYLSGSARSVRPYGSIGSEAERISSSEGRFS